MEKEFTLMEVLSATSGYTLTERFDRIHELIEWVIGRSVFTHEIPDVADTVKKRLYKQFPQLNVLQYSAENLAKDIRKENPTVGATKTRLVATYGDSFLVIKGNI